MKEEWAKEVRVRAFIQRILSIDLQQQLFHAECQIEASWLAEELRDAEEALFAVKLHDLKEDSQWREREKQRAPKSLFCVCMNRREKGWANVDLVLDSNDDTYSLTLPNLSKSDLAGDALQAYNRSRDKLRKRRFKAPRLALANLMKFGDHEKWLTIHSDPNRDHAPIVCYRWKVSAVFQQHMKLSQFPFDQQDLSIELQAGFEYDKTARGRSNSWRTSSTSRSWSRTVSSRRASTNSAATRTLGVSSSQRRRPIVGSRPPSRYTRGSKLRCACSGGAAIG